MRTTPKRPSAKLLAVLILFVLGMLALWNSLRGRADSADFFGWDYLEPKNPIYTRALDAVKEKLISPATVNVITARFRTEVEDASVKFDLDSQNKYGALVRQHWRVELRERKSGGWRLESVKEVAH